MSNNVVSLLHFGQVWLIFFAILQIVLAIEEIKKAVKDAKCKGVDIDISDEQMMLILECAQELGVMTKADMTHDKMPCFSKCLLEKKGLIDHDGKPHKEKIVESVDSSLPQDLAKDIKMHLGLCLDEHASKVMAKDETCKSFEPLTICVHKAYLELCTAS